MTSNVKPGIVTVGNFDGVHLGHQALVKQVVDRARAVGLRSYAVTFDPHPSQVLFPEHKRTYLTTAEERTSLLRTCGIDDIWVCRFTLDIARLEPEDFMRLIIERQPISELWVGSDFAMGRGRKGNIAFLAEMGGGAGWGLHVVPPYRYEGQVVSSTAIRTLLAAGAVRGAADLLGRPYRINGEAVSDHWIELDPCRALPTPGVYQASIRQADSTRESNVTVPSVPGRLDVSAPVEPGSVSVDFVRRCD